jgi:glycerol uptake facilitator-like aquaporin
MADVVSLAPPMTLGRRTVLEWMGTACLLAAVVGSGIMGQRLAGDNAAIVLLANSLATGAALFALIVTLGPSSGAHFNPVITAVFALRGALPAREAAAYAIAQIAGAFTGVAVAHVMFELPVFELSAHARSGVSQGLGEMVATFGLVLTVSMTAHRGALVAPVAIATYITGAYWWTSSTCFANPAVTLARTLTDTFVGIRPGDVPMFLLAQVAGAAASVGLVTWIFLPASVSTLRQRQVDTKPLRRSDA